MAIDLKVDANFISESAHDNLCSLLERYRGKAEDVSFENVDCDTTQFLVSVIIPTHNRKDTLKEAVDSVLMQVNCNVEVIIVDDASTDETGLFVHEHYGNLENVRYFRNESSLGPGKTRQKGYLNSTGDYVIFLDDDDLYIEPTFFEKALKCHACYPSCAFVCGNTLYFYQNKCSLKKHSLGHKGFIKGEKYFMGFSAEFKKPLSTFPSIFKRSVLDEADFRNMEMMNDASIYLRALCIGDVFILEDYVGAYRIHGTNISKGIDLDFLIGNMDEKYNIYLFSKSHRREQSEEWLKRQISISVRYYLSGNKRSRKDGLRLIKWCMAHSDYKVRWMLKDVLRSRIVAVKRKIDRVFKHK